MTLPFLGRLFLTYAKALRTAASLVISICITCNLLEQSCRNFRAPVLLSSKHAANTVKPISSRHVAKAKPKPIGNKKVTQDYISLIEVKETGDLRTYI